MNGTCEWIRENDAYISWLGSRSQLLWVSGGPGKGKSMLSIFLAEELEQMARQSGDWIVLQYFCENKDPMRNTATLVLRGLLSQILQQRPKLIDHMVPIFAMRKEHLFTDSSFEALWSCFEIMIRDPSLGMALCVVDGLDECNDAWLEVLLQKLRALFLPDAAMNSTCQLRMIILSREQPEFIARELGHFPRIGLEPHARGQPNSDIAKFIRGKVDELSKRRNYSPQLRLNLEEIFWKRAEGSFLWVGIIAKELEKHTSDEVKSVLNSFPSGLDELYDRLLNNIPPHRRETTARILRWVVTAIRPLTLMELSAAIGIIADEYSGQNCEQVMRDHVNECGYLLTVTESPAGPRVGLLHQSVKDYLLRETCDRQPELECYRTSRDSANLEVAKRCMDYLSSGALAAGEVSLYGHEQHFQAFPFLSYAILHWTEHARCLVDPNADIFDLSLPFYANETPIRVTWLKSYLRMMDSSQLHTLPHSLHITSFSALHFASFCGIVPLVQAILHRGEGSFGPVTVPNQTDALGRTALHWATSHARESVIQVLVQSGANPNLKDSDGFTPLDHAVTSMNGALVRVLLENGARLTDSNREGWTALEKARVAENEAMVELLLTRSPDVNAACWQGLLMLYWAANRGHEAVARLLLEYGVEYNANEGRSSTALHEAAITGHEAITRLLLEKGADGNAQDEYGRTVLQIAAKRGDEATVRHLLFQLHMDPNARDAKENTLLHNSLDHESTVQLLLDAGANPDAVNKDRQSVLYYAAKIHKHDAVLKLLLAKAADLNPKDKHGSPLLHSLASSGQSSTIELLLNQGVDPYSKDEDDSTALHNAAFWGRDSVVQLFLERKFNLSVKNKRGDTVLHEAARRARGSITQLLLRNRADPNATNEKGESPLHIATYGGGEGVVRLLLEYGADANARDFEGMTALMIAIATGKEGIARLLVDSDACFLYEDAEGYIVI